MDQSADFRVEVFLIGTKHIFCAQKRLVSFLIFVQEKMTNAFHALKVGSRIALRSQFFIFPLVGDGFLVFVLVVIAARDLVQKLQLFLGSLGSYQFFFELFNIHPEGLE